MYWFKCSKDQFILCFYDSVCLNKCCQTKLIHFNFLPLVSVLTHQLLDGLLKIIIIIMLEILSAEEIVPRGSSETHPPLTCQHTESSEMSLELS